MISVVLYTLYLLVAEATMPEYPWIPSYEICLANKRQADSDHTLLCAYAPDDYGPRETARHILHVWECLTDLAYWRAERQQCVLLGHWQDWQQDTLEAAETALTELLGIHKLYTAQFPCPLSLR